MRIVCSGYMSFEKWIWNFWVTVAGMLFIAYIKRTQQFKMRLYHLTFFSFSSFSRWYNLICYSINFSDLILSWILHFLNKTIFETYPIYWAIWAIMRESINVSFKHPLLLWIHCKNTMLKRNLWKVTRLLSFLFNKKANKSFF